VRAAVGEAAAGRHRVERRHLAGNRRQRHAAPRDFGQGGEQRLRVGVTHPKGTSSGTRTGEEFLAVGDFDQFAGVHDADAVRHFGDDAEIVGNQQHAHAALALELCQQVEDLCLHGDVECRRRLVGDQQVGLAGQRDGDHHALLHATRELEGVFVESPLRVGDADLAQQFQHALAGRLAAQPAM